jgi:acetyl-CoA carboxylase carboxyltransferase component
VDLRTPRILLLIRNAFGGAYASFNNYPTGADLVLALPTTRVAVMGPAGKEFVFKNELRAIRGAIAGRIAERTKHLIAEGVGAEDAARQAKADTDAWVKEEEAKLNQRYEKELMNPKEALSLGSISQIVMPTELRQSLGENLSFLLRHYTPSAMQSVQREFH